MEDNEFRSGARMRAAVDRELSRRGVLLAAGGAGAAALLAACTSSKSDRDPHKADKGPAKVQGLTIAVGNLGLQTPDPHLALGSGSNYVVTLGIAEGLARRDLNSKLIPNLAEKWEVSDDGLSWTFTLRDNVKMQDGSTFTADDVKTAVERVSGTDFTRAFAAFNAAKPTVKVIDTRHVVIATSKPYATMLDDMPVPIPTAYYKRVGDKGFRAKPKAAGCFKFVSQQLNNSMTFERFEGYFDTDRIANFKTLKLQIIPDESSRVAALQSGDVDAIHGLGPTTMEQLRQSSNVRVLPVSRVGMSILYFNDLNFPNRKTPFHDLRVRQALSYAIDRDAIVKTVFKGLGRPTANFWFESTPGYDTDANVTPYDPAKAKRLLQEAGATGIQMTLESVNTDAVIPNVLQLGQALQGYWSEVGLKVKYMPIDQAIVSSNNANKSWPSGAQISPFPGKYLLDPGSSSDIVFKSTGGSPRVNDPKLDALVANLDGTLDLTARAAAGLAIVRYVSEKAYALPLAELDGAVAVGPNVREWKQQAAIGVAGPWWYLRAN
jgi:peptide/nickel transport system substrate-binding protein